MSEDHGDRRIARRVGIVAGVALITGLVLTAAGAASALAPWTIESRSITGLTPAPWVRAVGISGDGSAMYGGQWGGTLYASADDGDSWRALPGAGSENWSAVDSSFDGTAVLALTDSGEVNVSSDSGATWTSQAFPGAPSFGFASVSDDGRTMLAVPSQSGSVPYLSVDAGATWAPIPVPAAYWFAADLSADGSTVVLGAAGGAGLFVSSDGGRTFANSHTSADEIEAVAASRDGATLVASVNGASRFVEISHDAGVTWTSMPLPATGGGWTALDISDDARVIVTANSVPGTYWISLDGGTTFVEQADGLDLALDDIRADAIGRSFISTGYDADAGGWVLQTGTRPASTPPTSAAGVLSVGGDAGAATAVSVTTPLQGTSEAEAVLPIGIVLTVLGAILLVSRRGVAALFPARPRGRRALHRG
ncbi:WD40/YVTN/BNR-like repeat-containing protein [Amnibacterium flavum]|uniref:Uncharacterized protein n=1 Tax=Amnibacterium flavum TaxID=2173173 RepID=A0A2V1HTR0_9MICO|nr:hypothetical protein [Amnibacterium flavum]PVZ95985.1 hypothetical protein DDQ50_05915 [Amnibacterium flavum]